MRGEPGLVDPGGELGIELVEGELERGVYGTQTRKGGGEAGVKNKAARKPCSVTR